MVVDRGSRWESLEELRPILSRWVARRCRDQNDVEDIVQETLLRAARYRGSLATSEKLRGWAIRIAANVLSDCARRDWRVRRSAVENHVLDLLEPSEPDEPEERPLTHVAGRWVESDEALDCLDRVLGDLRPADRDVLRSYYDGRQSCRETSEQCCIPLELVKVRLFRARERLRRALRRRLALVR